MEGADPRQLGKAPHGTGQLAEGRPRDGPRTCQRARGAHSRGGCAGAAGERFLTRTMAAVEDQITVLMAGVDYGDALLHKQMERELRNLLQQDRPLRVYLGIDPTATADRKSVVWGREDSGAGGVT